MFALLDEVLKSVDVVRCIANALETDLEIVERGCDRNPEIMLPCGADGTERSPIHRRDLVTPKQKHLHERRWTAPFAIARRHSFVRIDRAKCFAYAGDVREQIERAPGFAA